MSGNLAELDLLLIQLGSLADKFKHVIYMPGNHDFIFEQQPALVREKFKQQTPDNVHVVMHEMIEIEGYKFYAQPSVPELVTWAFGKMRMGTELKHIWDRAPKDVDVVISHGPPHGILDETCAYNNFSMKLDRVGCEIYRLFLPEFVNLKLALFGHIHEEHGAERIGEVIYSNGCFLNRQYDFDHLNDMHVYELNDSRAEFIA